MDKKIKTMVIKWGIIFTAILLMVATALILLDPVFAQGQDTCPATGDWIKVEGLSGDEFSYTAPEGKLIAETCYKAGTELEFNTISPPRKTVTVISTVGFDLSHASFRLVNAPDPSPTPTETFTPMPTFTATPTDEPTPSPTPTETFTPTPTEEFTPTPTEEITPTPTEELEFIPLSLSGICSGSVASIGVFQAEENTITWTVANENDQPITFNWSANNGESGSATVPANGSTIFVTAIDGFSVSLDYSFLNQSAQEQASIVPCEQQQETEEPTPQPTDSQPDEPAGGSGPSIISSLVPFIIGLPGIAAVSFLLLKSAKKPKA